MRAICALLGYAATASGFALGPVASAPRALAVPSIGRAALCTMPLLWQRRHRTVSNTSMSRPSAMQSGGGTHKDE